MEARSLPDHERPINERGVRSARRMGRFLSAIGQVPDLAVTSSAVRARTTLELASEAGEWECPIVVTDDLYGTYVDAVIAQLRAGDDQLESVLLTGHEPVWSELCSELIGRGNIRFPTAAMARITTAGTVTRTDTRPGVRLAEGAIRGQRCYRWACACMLESVPPTERGAA